MRILLLCLLLILPACSPGGPDGPAIMETYAGILESEELASLPKIIFFAPGSKDEALAEYKRQFAAIDDFKVSFNQVKTHLDKNGKSAKITFAIDSSWTQKKDQDDLKVGVKFIDGHWRLRFIEIAGVSIHVLTRLDSKGFHPPDQDEETAILAALKDYAAALEKEDLDGLIPLLYGRHFVKSDFKEYYRGYFELIDKLQWRPDNVKVEIADAGDEGLITFSLHMQWKQRYINPKAEARLLFDNGKWKLEAESVKQP